LNHKIQIILTRPNRFCIHKLFLGVTRVQLECVIPKGSLIQSASSCKHCWGSYHWWAIH